MKSANCPSMVCAFRTAPQRECRSESLHAARQIGRACAVGKGQQHWPFCASSARTKIKPELALLQSDPFSMQQYLEKSHTNHEPRLIVQSYRHVSIYLPVDPLCSIYSFACLFIHAYLYMYLTTDLICPSVYPSVHLRICTSIHLRICTFF